jgi:hypothetical protein
VKFCAPPGVSRDQWAAFRKQRKKPLNERSYLLLTNKLLKLAEDGWPPGEMIDLATERGWETVFAPRTFANDRSKPSPLDQLVAASFGYGVGNSEDPEAGSPDLDGRIGSADIHRFGGGCA